jgi:AcrR family transcriptional regulator
VPPTDSAAELLRIAAAEPPRERADAARNRRLLLSAAWKLFERHGVEGLTMDAVAREAGVGKGTVFRRFGDKSGLVSALLDDRERELQQHLLSGPAPLGPGAPDDERVLAFAGAYLAYLQTHLELSRVSETAAPGARYRIGAYWFWVKHLTTLSADAQDPEFRAHAVLALLDADLIHALLGQGWSWERIRAAVEAEVKERTAR